MKLESLALYQESFAVGYDVSYETKSVMCGNIGDRILAINGYKTKNQTTSK